jgi:hypothetical protein
MHNGYRQVLVCSAATALLIRQRRTGRLMHKKEPLDRRGSDGSIVCQRDSGTGRSASAVGRFTIKEAYYLTATDQGEVICLKLHHYRASKAQHSRLQSSLWNVDITVHLIKGNHEASLLEIGAVYSCPGSITGCDDDNPKFLLFQRVRQRIKVGTRISKRSEYIY